LSRQKFIINFVFAIIEARQVQFQEMTLRFCSQADPALSLRRIQRFFADFLLDDGWLARLIMNDLPSGKLTLCLGGWPLPSHQLAVWVNADHYFGTNSGLSRRSRAHLLFFTP
jgi:hypothetical protein